MKVKLILPGLILAILTVLIFRLAGAASAFTYVSATNGNDTAGDGSSAKPFKTITKALRTLSPGSTIQVAAGTYDVLNGESFPILMRNGVDLIASDQGATTITGIGMVSSGVFGRFPAVIVGADATISGFRILIPSNSAVGTHPPTAFFVPGNSLTLVIRDNMITSAAPSTAGVGVYINGGSVSVISNRIFGIGLNGVSTRVEPSSLIIQGNVLEGNGGAADDFHSGDAITVIATSLDISNNTITKNSGNGITVGSAGRLLLKM